jgi:hypothetical protein
MSWSGRQLDTGSHVPGGEVWSFRAGRREVIQLLQVELVALWVL